MQRILLVDDNIEILRVLARLLRYDGFDVVPIGRPEAAFEMLHTDHFDVVVSDLEMPRIDGVTMLDRARATQPLARLFMVSGSLRAQALRIQDVVILGKPLDYAIFLGHLSAPAPSSWVRATASVPRRVK